MLAGRRSDVSNTVPGGSDADKVSDEPPAVPNTKSVKLAVRSFMLPPPAKDVNEAVPTNDCRIWPMNGVAALVLFRLRFKNALNGAPALPYCVTVTATSVPLIVVVVLEALFVAVMVDALEFCPKVRMTAALAIEVMPRPQATTAAEAILVQEAERFVVIRLSNF